MTQNGCWTRLGNVIWFIFGGFILFLEYLILGLVFFVTIIGIPFALQLWKISFMALFPFGKKVVQDSTSNGCSSMFLTILWFPFGLTIAVSHAIVGLIFCITIIGIPFGKQHLKLAMLAFYPFGKKVVTLD
jgi:uncharacterized membrane protein YccF (DUF307 family)